MENQFSIKIEIRVYTPQEIAQIFFPNIQPKSASQQLRRWIMENKELLEELEREGFTPGQRLFSPKQVETLFSFWGCPGVYFYTYNI